MTAMAGDLYAGADFGTSSVKLLVVDDDGATVVEVQESYPTDQGPGRIEQDPAQWWDAARRALAVSGVADRIGAIGLTGQMQDLIPVLDGGWTRPAILYSDTRGGAHLDRLLTRYPHWQERTGNVQDASNLLGKVAWLREHDPDALEQSRHLLFGPAGYLAWRLTGRALCDVTTASTTGLWDAGAARWLDTAFAAEGGRVATLPEVVGLSPGDTLAGRASAEAAADLGLPAGTPIVLAAGDAGAATDGLVGTDAGDAYAYLGTTGWVAGVVAEVPDPLTPALHTLALPHSGNRLRIGAVQSAGAAARWAREQFFPGRSVAEVDRAVADRVDVLDDRPLVLPGLAGERSPLRDADLRGAFVGVTERTTRADLYLAVLTGVAMGLRHAADAIGAHQSRLGIIGGGSASAPWLRICADVFDVPVFAGTDSAAGCWSSIRAASRTVGDTAAAARFRPLLAASDPRTEVVPSAAAAQYQRVLSTHRALYDTLRTTFHEMASPRTPD